MNSFWGPNFVVASFTDRPPAPAPDDGSEAPKKRHTLLTFGYTGTGYFGLQPQSAEGDPERPTVADVLRAALLKEGFIAPSNYVPLSRTKWSLASRTDKGVHAVCAAGTTPLVPTACVAHVSVATSLQRRARSLHTAPS